MASVRFWTVIFLLLPFILLTACAQADENSSAVATSAVSPTLVNSTTTPTSTISVDPEDDGAVFYGPLSVVITQPVDNSTVHQSPLVISGKADPGTVISLNDEVVLVDDSGVFTSQISLAPGINMIEITASDFQNHQDYSYMTVFLETEP